MEVLLPGRALCVCVCVCVWGQRPGVDAESQGAGGEHVSLQPGRGLRTTMPAGVIKPWTQRESPCGEGEEMNVRTAFASWERETLDEVGWRTASQEAEKPGETREARTQGGRLRCWGCGWRRGPWWWNLRGSSEQSRERVHRTRSSIRRTQEPRSSRQRHYHPWAGYAFLSHS